jgi:hypothetical protein
MNQEILSLASQIESLDDALQMWSALKSKERDMNWCQGDFLALMISRFGDSKETFGKFAEVGWGKIAHLRQIVRIAQAYPDEEERLPDVKWAYFRSCYNASTRTGETPFEVLTKALELNWSQKDVDRYGRPPDDVIFEVSGECPTCGAVFAIRTTEFIPGEIKCPICALKGEDTVVGELSRKE